jgi:hypothetical protein
VRSRRLRALPRTRPRGVQRGSGAQGFILRRVLRGCVGRRARSSLSQMVCWTAAPAKPARPLCSASQASALRNPYGLAQPWGTGSSSYSVVSARAPARMPRGPLEHGGRPCGALRLLDGRTGKAGTPSLVGVASERLGRAHLQSRHALFGRVASERLGRAHLQSRHALFGRRRKRAPSVAITPA